MRISISLSLLAIASFAPAGSAQAPAHPDGRPWSENNFYSEVFGAGLPFAPPELTAFVAEQPPAGDEAPRQDPLIPVRPLEVQPPADLIAAKPSTMPSVLAGQTAGIGFLIAGVAGWILLSLAFLILLGRQRRRPAEEPRTQ